MAGNTGSILIIRQFGRNFNFWTGHNFTNCLRLPTIFWRKFVV